jgi:hypothetical protein
MEPDLAQFDGTWDAHLNVAGSSCLPIPDFPCTISNGAVSCLDGLVQATVDPSGSVVGIIDLLEDDCTISNGDVICLDGVVEGTVDSSGFVDGTISFLGSKGELSGTLQDGSGGGRLSYPGCSGDWTLTKQ